MDKPAGPTSHDVVAIARRAYRTRRVGHAGTLDPFASGLLLVLVGRATRLAPYLVGLSKTYEGVVRLGESTETDDHMGRVVSRGEWRALSDADIAGAMTTLTGQYAQQPPAYSARKVAGERAYARARRGEAVTLEARPVEVRRFALVARDGADVRFSAEVSSGTYVRALARDLGAALGCGAHLMSLRRVSVGSFTLSDAADVDEVRAGRVSPRPSLEAVRDLPRHGVDDAARTRIRQGQALEVPDAPYAAGPVALVAGDTLVAVAEMRAGRLEPRVVLES